MPNNPIIINQSVDSLSGSFYYSIVTMSSLGYGDIMPITTEGRILTAFQILISFFMVIVIFGSLIRLLLKPKTLNDIRPLA